MPKIEKQEKKQVQVTEKQDKKMIRAASNLAESYVEALLHEIEAVRGDVAQTSARDLGIYAAAGLADALSGLSAAMLGDSPLKGKELKRAQLRDANKTLAATIGTIQEYKRIMSKTI